VLDTETTGLEVREGHRLIEIGCVEIVNRRVTDRTFHVYLQPDREVDPGAIAIHGISNEDLADKPRFAEVAAEFLEFVRGARLVIHNAPFDLGFLNNELRLASQPESRPLDEMCTILDTLVLERRLHPGQRASLDALCKRYGISNSHRELHGALLDAELLAGVYLVMTSGQVALSLEGADGDARDPGDRSAAKPRRVDNDRPRLRVIGPTAEELAEHRRYLELLDESSDGACLWRRLEPDAAGD
jgi:DNA polymerase-3 subunit epsilon